MSEIEPIPQGFHSVNAYLTVSDAAEAREFYKKAFDAKEGICLNFPDGSIMHTEVIIGDSTVMFASANPQWGTKCAKALGGSPVSLMIYCEDADALFEKATAAGCSVVMPMTDMFWGDRMGKVEDPFGIQWSIGTHTEDVPDEEMDQRAAQWLASMQPPE